MTYDQWKCTDPRDDYDGEDYGYYGLGCSNLSTRRSN